MSHIQALIMAGGSGTRLWPLSRVMLPKQFNLKLDGESTMLEATIGRLAPLVSKENVTVITGELHAKGAAFHDIKNYHPLIEPVARNTAPAIALAAAHAVDFANDPLLLVLPADHTIADVPAFHAAIKAAAEAAEAGHIATFGIQPTRPETGYGYIKAKPGTGTALPVDRFVEKPDAAKAAQFVADGSYYWNSGMFLAKAGVWLAEVQAHLPEVHTVIENIRAEWKGNQAGTQAAINKHFAAMPNISIDYGVLEKSSNVVVVPCNLGWSDVGAWDAVHNVSAKDEQGNAVQATAILRDSKNCLVVGGKRLIATVGVEDLCIVDTEDALLISRKDRAQEVKDVVEEVKKRGGEQHMLHTTVKRPWGSYTVLEDATSGYKIKRIEVIPGGQLSLQSHKHRSEHWVVVAGTATVTCDGTVSTLTPGQSTYMPLGCKHRLQNKGDVPVQIVEVQVGDYLGEDDIIRYDDIYGRN